MAARSGLLTPPRTAPERRGNYRALDSALLRHGRLHPLRGRPAGRGQRPDPALREHRQARQELPRDWGWHLAARTGRPEDDELLCPPCAAADTNKQPHDPGRHPPEARPAPGSGLPPNARIIPSASRLHPEGG